MSSWNVLEWTVSWQLLFQGLVHGIVIAGFATGLVLVYQATRIINFAHAAMGVFAASVSGLLIERYGWPLWIAMALGVALGASIGGMIELIVVRRLFERPRLILFVATLGVSQLLLYGTIRLPETRSFNPYPTPVESNWDVGPIRLRGDHLVALVGTALMLVVLFCLLEYTRFGTRIRASAANPHATRLAGISTRRVSTEVWIAAGILATVSVMLFAPVTGQSTNALATAVGEELLIKALAAAALGALVSYPRTLVAGLAIGVTDQLLITNVDLSGAISNLVLLLVVLLVLLVNNQAIFGQDDDGAFFSVPREKLAPEHVRNLPIVALVPRLTVGLLLAVAVALPQLISTPSTINLWSRVLVYIIVALSAVVLTGWAGQLSLGQFAFVGLGAFTTNAVVRDGDAFYNNGTFYAGIVVATGAGVVAAVIMGGPALRFRGLSLAIVTFGFAIVARDWLFRQEVFLGEAFAADVRRPAAVETPERYYYLCLAAVVVALFIASRYRRTGPGRALLAVRDNEENASSLTISPARSKLVAFAFAGGLAAFAGALLAGLQVQFGAGLFPTSESLRIVSVAVIGGIASVVGAVLGAVWVVGLPVLFDDSEQVRLLTSGIGLLILLMYFPGGLIQVVHNGRDLLFGWLVSRSDRAEQPPTPRPSVASLSTRPARPDSPVPALRVDDVSVQFDGLAAVSAASIQVTDGEVVGLIGTNGAGKSTLMNAISGFVVSTGRIELRGERLDDRSPHSRAAAGLGRGFQDARLFPSLTVKETIQVALEGRDPSHVIPSMFMLPPSPARERRTSAVADEIITWLGLGRYADSVAGELSTGTRRIVELACLVALDADLLLLDEPTAGVAQRECEALGRLITSIRDELGAPVLVIEHNMPLVMSISDRIYCLEAGRVIAEGTPEAIAAHPRVIASYLGAGERAT